MEVPVFAYYVPTKSKGNSITKFKGNTISKFYCKHLTVILTRATNLHVGIHHLERCFALSCPQNPGLSRAVFELRIPRNPLLSYRADRLTSFNNSTREEGGKKIPKQNNNPNPSHTFYPETKPNPPDVILELMSGKHRGK